MAQNDGGRIADQNFLTPMNGNQILRPLPNAVDQWLGRIVRLLRLDSSPLGLSEQQTKLNLGWGGLMRKPSQRRGRIWNIADGAASRERDSRFLDAGHAVQMIGNGIQTAGILLKRRDTRRKLISLLLFGIKYSLKTTRESFDPSGQSVEATADLGLFRSFCVEAIDPGRQPADVGLG